MSQRPAPQMKIGFVGRRSSGCIEATRSRGETGLSRRWERRPGSWSEAVRSATSQPAATDWDGDSMAGHVARQRACAS